MKKAATYVLVALLTLSVVAVWAQGPNAPDPNRPRQPRTDAGFAGRMMMTSPVSATMPPAAQTIERQAEVLKLTPDQKASLIALLTKSQENARPLQQKLGQVCGDLRQALTAPQYDAAKVKQLQGQAQAAENAIVDANVATWVQLRGILTADQIARLARPALGNRRPGGPGAPGQPIGPGGQPAPPPPPPGGEGAPPPPGM